MSEKKLPINRPKTNVTQGGFKLATTRVGKDKTMLHVLDTHAKIKRITPQFPGDLQVPEFVISVDEKGKVKAIVKNAYELGIVTHVGQREENYKKLDKKTNETIERMRKVHVYETKPITFIQGTDGNFYLLVGVGVKVHGTLSEGRVDLSSYVRNLVSPKLIVDISTPKRYTFAIDKDTSSFIAIQSEAGVLVKSEKPLQGYKLTLMGVAEFDEEAVTSVPEAVKVPKVAAEITEDDF